MINGREKQWLSNPESASQKKRGSFSKRKNMRKGIQCCHKCILRRQWIRTGMCITCVFLVTFRAWTPQSSQSHFSGNIQCWKQHFRSIFIADLVSKQEITNKEATCVWNSAVCVLCMHKLSTCVWQKRQETFLRLTFTEIILFSKKEERKVGSHLGLWRCWHFWNGKGI